MAKLSSCRPACFSHSVRLIKWCCSIAAKNDNQHILHGNNGLALYNFAAYATFFPEALKFMILWALSLFRIIISGCHPNPPPPYMWHPCPCPSRKTEPAAGREILHKLMEGKLGNSLTEELNHCHYFQLIHFDLCLGAGSTAMAVAEQGENHSLSAPVTIRWLTVTRSISLVGAFFFFLLANPCMLMWECRPRFHFCQTLDVINKMFTRPPASTFIMKHTLLPHNYSITAEKRRERQKIRLLFLVQVQFDH